MIAFINGLVFSIRHIQTQQMEYFDYTVIHRPITIIIIGLLIIPLIFKYKNVLLRRTFFLLTLFAVWQIISVVWSDNKLWTSYRSLEFMVIAVLAAYTAAILNDSEGIKKWMNWVWGWYVILILTVWIGAILSPKNAFIQMPNATLPFMLNGVYPRMNANTIAQISGIIAIVGFCRILERPRKQWVLLTFFGFATMVIAQGRSGLAAFLLSGLLVLILLRRINILLGMLIIILVLAVTANAFSLFYEFFRRGQSQQQLLGLTGRLFFWQYAWSNFIVTKPILGFGAYSGTRFLVMPQATGVTTALSVHNTWIELLVNVGFVGTLIFIILIARLWLGLLRHAKYSDIREYTFVAAEMIAVLSICILRSFFTANLAEHNQYPLFLSLGVVHFLHTKVRVQTSARGKSTVSAKEF